HLEVVRYVEPAGFDAKVALSVQGAEKPGELPVGKDVTYTITYGNFGNATAPKVSVRMNLPAGLTLVSADPSSTRTSKSDEFPGGTVGWDPGDLPVGVTRLIKCRVHVASVNKEGSVVRATVSAQGTDLDASNNTAYSRRYATRGAAASRLSRAANAVLLTS